MCAAVPDAADFGGMAVTTASTSACPRRRRIVSGTFNSPNLFVLEFDDMLSTLRVLHDVEALGPHQYLAYGVSARGRKTVYATTWAAQSTLSAWHFDATPNDVVHGQEHQQRQEQGRYGLTFGNKVEIPATGSYVHVQPPPHSSLSGPSYGSEPGVGRYLGSAGGPTGELHTLDPTTGLITAKLAQLVFLDDPASLAQADKTRKALRYGAHSFDVTARANDRPSLALIADLGSNAVKVYTFPDMQWLYDITSAKPGDGPRHAVPHPRLPLVFTVTEHTNFVDWYRLGADVSPTHIGRIDMLTPHQADVEGRSNWRGDTLRFSSDLRYLFATTRGKTSQFKGLLVAYRVAETPTGITLTQVCRYETRTSGGKANAIELAPIASTDAQTENTTPDLLVLTDDEQGWIDVLEWNPVVETFVPRGATQLPPLAHEPQGASHAIWLD